METINIHEAKTHLSRLVEKAAKGESFIIAKAGRPMVKVVALDAEEQPKPKRRIGFMAGEIEVPDDFNTMGQEEIERMFYGE
ncbi:MAG: type II toxin-antitoxin system prevent-host-death family antitoxin [Mesorhizobium sp.]|nr:type II toxin-antitoxin system prevent-host-death family antitoxin [Mesorhizobium sp.]